MVLRPSDSALRKYLPSGLSFVNATVLRGAVTMRVTISGGLVYFSFARTSLGFHPCCMTSCANIGRAARARPTAPSNTGRSVGEKRVIADSRRDDYGGRAYQRVYGMRWVGVGRKTGARNQGPGSGNDVFPTLAPASPAPTGCALGALGTTPDKPRAGLASQRCPSMRVRRV